MINIKKVIFTVFLIVSANTFTGEVAQCSASKRVHLSKVLCSLQSFKEELKKDSERKGVPSLLQLTARRIVQRDNWIEALDEFQKLEMDRDLNKYFLVEWVKRNYGKLYDRALKAPIKSELIDVSDKSLSRIIARLFKDNYVANDVSGGIKIGLVKTGENFKDRYLNDFATVEALVQNLPDEKCNSYFGDEVEIFNPGIVDFFDMDYSNGGFDLSFAVLPNGNIVTRLGHVELKIWNPSTKKCLSVLNDVYYSKLSPNNIVTLGFYFGRDVKMCESESGILLRVLNDAYTGTPSIVGFLPCGDAFLVLLSGEIIIFDFKTGQKKRTFKLPEFNLLAGILPNNNMVLGDISGPAKIWDSNNNKSLLDLDLNKSEGCKALVLPNGNIAVYNKAGKVKVFDVFSNLCKLFSEDGKITIDSLERAAELIS